MFRTGDETDEADTEDLEADESSGERPDEAPLDPIDAHFDAVDERVQQLCDTALKPRIAALEADRLKVRAAIMRGVTVLAVPILLFFFGDAVGGLLEAVAGNRAPVRWLVDNLTLVTVGVALVAVGYLVVAVAMPGIAAHLNYRRRFKNELVVELFKAVMPSGTYQPDHHVTQAVFDRSGIWSGRYRSFLGDDLVRGRIGAIEFEASEIKAEGQLTVEHRSRRETMTRQPNVTTFHGLFFHFGLDRSLEGHTIIEPEDAEGRLPGHRRGFERVIIEDETFGESFRVYATHPAEAAALVGPRFRERLLKLTDHLLTTPFLAFVGNHAFFATHSGRPMLEPTIAKPASYATLSVAAEFFALPEVLVKELALAPATFATGGPPAILAEPSAAGLVATLADEPEKALAAGDVMGLAMQPVDERDLARSPPAESRVRVSPLTGEGLSVTYGITPSFFVRVLWTLALTPFVVAGVARLVGQSGQQTLDAITAQIPLAALVADWAAVWPVPFSIVAVLFYALPTWALLHLPSGLRIDRQGVRVSRRLWPLAKVYPLDRIADIRVTDKQVALKRKDASGLRRYAFPAPPMRTAEEARWLGAHMRRALKMFGGLQSHS